MLDELMPLNMIGIKKVQGGSLEESLLIPGVAFKKTFSYAGFEMQQKSYKNPRIALLNIELELKAEKDNAEVRVDNVEEVQIVRRMISHKVGENCPHQFILLRIRSTKRSSTPSGTSCTTSWSAFTSPAPRWSCRSSPSATLPRR